MSESKGDSFLKRLLHPGKPESLKELEDVIDDARRREIISRNTEDMIKGVFDVGRQRISEIMIPRTQMITISADSTLEEAAAVVAESGHSRYPVISGDKDHIEGILLAKDLLPALAGLTKVSSLRELLREAVIVPESKHVSSMLREFQNRRFHLAVAVNEFGGVSGLITIEDILELIVGDIDDEYDEIHTFIGVHRRLVDGGAQLVLRLVNSRGIQENQLAAVSVIVFHVRVNSGNPVSGSLRLAGCNCNLLSQNLIQQRRLSYIRSSDNSNKP